MKKLLILFFLLIFILPLGVSADMGVVINFFFSPTCPHCADEVKFLDQLENKYPALTVDRFDLTKKENIDLVQIFYNKYQVPEEEYGLTPATFIELDDTRGKYFIGYSESIDKVVTDYLDSLFNNNTNNTSTQIVNNNSSGKISIPFIGKIEMTSFSPLFLSLLVGGLDGFNACAMVALGFLLAVVISTGSRRRVFLIGGVFIFVSGLMYFIFISAWVSIFSVVGAMAETFYIGSLEITVNDFINALISFIIILFSIFLLKDYFTGVVCKICDVDGNKEGFFTKTQRWMFVKMSRVVTNREVPLYLTLISVSLVAIGVNLLELGCSFGFPLAYTKVLTGYNLPSWQYYSYLFVYIIMYMLDDFLIFMIAVVTLRVTKFGDKYLKAIKLISGIILLFLGIFMFFRL